MSMIMRVARGTPRDLERLAESGGDDGLLPPAFEQLIRARQAAIASMTPEMRAQMEALLRASPQLGSLAPQVMERLQQGFPSRPPGAQPAGSAGGRRRRAGAAVSGPETIDLHKSWHILHFLFTGRAAEGGTPPANFLMEGGREIGEDMGYGPGHLLDTRETADFAGFTGSLTVEVLTRRIDAPRMASLGIYCAGDAGTEAAGEIAEDVETYFPLLQSHLQAAAQEGQSTLVWLS